MSQCDSRSFGNKPQARAVNPLPFSQGISANPDRSGETLSDVANVAFSALQGSNDNLSHDEPLPQSLSGRDPLLSGLSDAAGCVPLPDSGPKCQHSEEVFLSTPNTCNTGVSSSHDQLQTGEIDTLEVSLYGLWSPTIWNAIKPQFNAARKRAEGGLDDAAYIVSGSDDRLNIRPSGVKHGVYCRWVFDWQGCTIAVVDNPAPSEARLSIHVTIGSIRLMDVGRVHAWESLLSVLAALGYEHIRDVVGRVDPCVDLANESMAQVAVAVNGDRLICRARKDASYRNCGQLETFTAGGREKRVRIYDKVAECRNDPVKRALLRERRWGVGVSEAIRVEFQLRRKALKRHFQVQTVDELFANLGTITKWCTHEWFRIASKRVDRKNKNQSRAVTSAFWLRVQEAFRFWTGTALPRSPMPRRVAPVLDGLKQQAAGCVSSIAAQVEGSSFLGVLAQLGREFKEEAAKATELKRFKLRAAARTFEVPDSEIPF